MAKAKKTATGKAAGLSVFDGVMMLVGIVVGIGIFKTPTLVAANSDSGVTFIGLWVLGGFIALVGALCYAELGSSHPNSGGEYHFLSKAYGEKLGMLFGWARCTIVQPGAIAAVAFVYGEYISEVINLGRYSFAIHGAIAVAILTWVNLIGLREASWTQNLFASLAIAALIIVIVAALYVGPQSTTATVAKAPASPFAAADSNADVAIRPFARCCTAETASSMACFRSPSEGPCERPASSTPDFSFSKRESSANSRWQTLNSANRLV